MKNVIFLAPPLAGKGTFSEYLIKEYGYQHYSTGDLLREKAKRDEKLQNLLLSGSLVDDETILKIVKEVLQKRESSKPFILDGVPRTLHQAKNLDIILNDLGCNDFVVIQIKTEKDILVDRVVGRRICPNCHRSYNVLLEGFKPKNEHICDACGSTLIQRKDDNLESFEVRYQAYLESTVPIISYYEEKGILRTISNNESNQERAFEELRGVISGH